MQTILRDWPIGWVLAFQASQRSSILLSRSKKIETLNYGDYYEEILAHQVIIETKKNISSWSFTTGSFATAQEAVDNVLHIRKSGFFAIAFHKITVWKKEGVDLDGDAICELSDKKEEVTHYDHIPPEGIYKIVILPLYENSEDDGDGNPSFWGTPTNTLSLFTGHSGCIPKPSDP